MTTPTWAPSGEQPPRPVKAVASRATIPTARVSDATGVPHSNPDHFAGTGLGPDGLDIGGLLGRGGMGEVRVARDLRLGRDVAVKTARPGDADAAARLAREAAMTARLEHPNIVPVYAAGTDAEGQPWYAMRLLPGRSLDAALHEAKSWSERARLVRHVLGAAEALAYAHGRGVLHRDVKPANIMVGPFGETVVADWGLACTLDEAAKPRGTAGTPGYMSPEQIAGLPSDGRTDVYGLGAVLFTLCTGSPPPATGPIPEIPEEVPRELATVVERALEQDLDRRYPSARAFADDLLAWFEGRRVTAHDYTPAELLARFWAAWRVPILIAVVGLLVSTVAVSVGWYRTAAARSRALVSEAKATEARDAGEAALASALLGQARNAALADRPLEAELFAVHSMVRRDGPDARGVLAQFGGRPRQDLVRSGSIPEGCHEAALSPAGDRLACLDADHAWVVAVDDPGHTLGEAPGRWNAAAFAGNSKDIVLLTDAGTIYGWRAGEPARLILTAELQAPTFGPSLVPGMVSISSRGSVFRVDLRTDVAERAQGCPLGGSILPTAIDAEGGVWTTCDDGAVRHETADGSHVAAHLAAGDAPPYAMADLGNDGVLVGTVDGWVVRFVQGREVDRVRVGYEGARRFAVRDGLVAVGTSSGYVQVWDLATGEIVARLTGTQSSLAWLPDGALRIVSDRVEDRRIPRPGRPQEVALDSGVSGIAVSPDGTRIAAGLGDGRVVVLDEKGVKLADWRWQDGVVKDIAFDPSGTRLAVATARGSDQRVIDVSTGAILAQLPPQISRRVAWFSSGWLIQASYDHVLNLVKDGRVETYEANVGELEQVEDVATAIDQSDNVYRIEDADPPRVRRIGAVRKNSATCPFGPDTLVTVDDAVLRLGPDGHELARWPTPARARDLTCTADARRAAAGLLDSSVIVWGGDGTVLARLIGHRARVGAVSFTPDGQWLISGGWDGALRFWWMGDLETPAVELRDRAVSTWGRSLDQLLTWQGQ